jgi:DNA-directed RNA polymerase specialized sigma subunit
MVEGENKMPGPLDDYMQSKEAAQTKRKADEITLLNKWKSGGRKPKDLQPLLKLYEPVISQKVRQYKAPTVPESSFKAELQTHLIKAFETYDPSKGAALNTHADNYMRKAMRYNNRFQNLLYIPEGVSGQIGKLQKARDALTEDLGRPPTTEEIAQHTGLKPKRIDTILSAVRRDIPMGRSGGEEGLDYGASDGSCRGFEEQQIAVAQHILPDIFPNKPEMHTLFHYTFGTNGHQKITKTNDLAKKMGKSAPQISRMKTQMGETLRKHMGLEEDED